ncbi:transcriptional regulator [Actinoplanes sp. NPDC026619]|uniref:transcriptional regulator n=1 Tax=Actinoplanes sp. NPDC026619 TaxID=3155798 RepID=UPI0033D17977
MRIGLVVPAGHRQRFADAARIVDGVELAWAVYERDDEIRDLVGGLLRESRLDGLLMGLLPWAHSRDLLPPSLPVAVTRQVALDLALAWARARGNGWAATPVAIDTFDREIVDEVAGALELDAAQIATLPFDPGQPIDEIVAFHRKRLAETGASYLITGRTAVAAILGREAAVLHAAPTAETIRAGLHELVLRARERQRFATGLFVLGAPGSDRARVGLQHLLLHTPEFADAWIDQRGHRALLVFAPASLFEAATRQWVGLPVLGDARDQLGMRVVAGFGIGGSARLSVDLAEQAAARAEQEPGSVAYLFTDDGVTIGPMGAIGAAPPLTWTHREHGALEILATKAGLSPATLSRLASVERGLGGRLISPGELAKALGITDPSGRRLIRKLTDADLVIEGGSTQVTRKGRPARLYRLAITSALEAAE